MTRIIAGIGVVAAAVALVATAFVAPASAAQAWLLGAIFFSTIPLGAIALRLTAKLTGGERQDGVPKALMAATRTTPLLWFAALPIVVAAPLIYPWARAPHDLYMAPLFVAARTIIALGGWTWLARLCLTGRLTQLSAGLGLLFHGVAVSVVSVDWVLSVEPRWVTTDFAMTLAAWQFLGAAAAAILATGRREKPVRDDYASVLAGSLIAAIYFGFMSWMVAWYGDRPDATRWFRDNPALAWSWLSGGAAALAIAAIVVLLGTRRRRLGAVMSLAALGLYLIWWLAPHFGLLAAWLSPLGLAVMCAAAIALRAPEGARHD